MFNKGDYIVVLKGDFSYTKCAKENYCFKQRGVDNNDYSYLQPEKDLDLCKYNGNSNLRFDKTSWLKDWRYATQEEIEEYDRLNKPYDVTSLNSFVLPERWHVLVTEENQQIVSDWRLEYKNTKNLINIDKIVGICNPGEKGHNPKTELKSDTYDFGIEITTEQFRKYVLGLNVEAEDTKYLINIFKELGVT